jgi:hypothetical protein
VRGREWKGERELRYEKRHYDRTKRKIREPTDSTRCRRNRFLGCNLS